MPKNKASIYRLKITLANRVKRNTVWRVIEIPSDATLLVLHTMIFRAFDRTKERLWSFYLGRPGTAFTAEYALHVYDLVESGPHADALPAKGVRLKDLAPEKEKEIYYQFDYSDEWWHWVEFLGAAERMAGVDYPRITDQAGKAPPQFRKNADEETEILALSLPSSHEGLSEGEGLRITMQDSVTFEELDAALSQHKGALSVAATIGLVLGCQAAPHPVSPTKYLSRILGERAIGTAKAQRIVSLVLSLHNQVAHAITDNQPLNLFRGMNPDARQGLTNLSKDLGAQLDAFKEGLLWGTERKRELPAACSESLGRLWAWGFQVHTVGMIRWNRNRSMSDEVVLRQYTDLQRLAPQILDEMLAVARIMSQFRRATVVASRGKKSQ